MTKFQADDIVWLKSPVGIVRSRPDMYLRGDFSPADVAGRLAGDALILEATEVSISRFHEWHIVRADLDWLTNQPNCTVAPRDAFFQIIRFPEASANAMRGEILLTAFAHSVVCASPDERFVVKGEIEDDDVIWSQMVHPNTARSIAFR